MRPGTPVPFRGPSGDGGTARGSASRLLHQGVELGNARHGFRVSPRRAYAAVVMPFADGSWQRSKSETSRETRIRGCVLGRCPGGVGPLSSTLIAMSNTLGPRVGQTVRAPKTAELIAAQLRRRIVKGELTPGETLPPENQLMEQFGVSRPTLREAFRILEAEMLISVRRGSRGGAQVMAPDFSVAARHVGLLLQMQGTTVDDVYEARMVAEPACARLLTKRRTKQDIADLNEVVAELESAVEATGGSVPNPVLWSRLTYRFHELIMQRSGNKTLAVQGAVLQEIVATHLEMRVARNFDSAESLERFQRAIKAYKRLVALVEARDAEGAERHWRNHMKVAGTYLLKDELHNKPVVDLFA
ncbi:regulatory protein GntR HTH [Actinobacteria bacterium OK074]|nr:regulatory protein GntR HTH [Actinobacteria bacterium OK074]